MIFDDMIFTIDSLHFSRPPEISVDLGLDFEIVGTSLAKIILRHFQLFIFRTYRNLRRNLLVASHLL